MSVVVDRPRGLVPTIGGSTYVKPSEMGLDTNPLPVRSADRVSGFQDVRDRYPYPEREDVAMLANDKRRL